MRMPRPIPVIEGKVEDILIPDDRRMPPEVLLMDAKAIVLEPDRGRPGNTIGIGIGPCLPGGLAAAGKFIGQRMRFFGDRDADARRRFFYAEPARKTMQPTSEKTGEKQDIHNTTHNTSDFLMDQPLGYIQAPCRPIPHRLFTIPIKYLLTSLSAAPIVP